MRKSIAAIALGFALAFACVAPGDAQFTVFDPANFAKNTLTELHTLEATLNQATQITNEFKQLAYEVQNLQNIPSGIWGQIKSDLNALTRIVKVGQSISYADQNLSSEFTRMYPGYSVPRNYQQAYQQWGQNALGGIQGALLAAGLQSGQYADEEGIVANLQSLSDGAVGRMEAIQVGNMIGVQMVQQLQKLRQLHMAQLQGEFSYLATQQQNDLTKFATLQSWLDSQKTYKSSE